MRIIVGIGNPGSRYKYNRHNIGFMLLDYVAEKHSLSFFPSKKDYYYTEGEINNSDFCLIKPSTYVNNSGITVSDALKSYNVDVIDCLVAVDDLNLDLGVYRVRASGGDGGHNGLSSLIYHLNSDQFPRIRIGIGKDFDKDRMAEFVLSDFSESEEKILEKTFNNCTSLVESFIDGGFKKMLDLNSTLKDSENKE